MPNMYRVLAAFIGLVGLIEAVPGNVPPEVLGTSIIKKNRAVRGLPPPVIGTLSGGQKARALEGGLLQRAGRAVATSDKEAAVVRFESDIKPDHFQYAYETNNGISAQASGSLKKGPEGEAIAVQGQYHYSSPDGTPIEVNYVADESGYHPTGDHIPTPPPVPAYIARSLEYNAAHPQPAEKRQ